MGAHGAWRPPGRVQVALAVVGLVLCGTGGALLGTSLATLQDLSTATLAECYLVNFQANTEATVVLPEAACKSICGFQVQGVVPGGSQEAFIVKDFMPALRTSYRSSTGVNWVDPQFKCCPPTTADCCGFRDESTRRFCDNWGDDNKDCPRGGWPCYIQDMESLMDDRKEIAAEHLLLGSDKEARRNLIAGPVLLVLGALSLMCIRPMMWFYPCICCWYSLPTPREIKRRLAKALPEVLWTEEMREIAEDDAVLKIQKMVRGMQARQRVRELLRIQEHALTPKREWTRDMVHGPFVPQASALLEQGLLYDTGSDSTFRRVVHSRVVSAPGDRFERVEVSLNKPATWLEGAFRFKAGHPPEIAQAPPKAFAEVYGVREGYRLLGVGKLKWPTVDARELVHALRVSQRPVILLFEGTPQQEELPRRPENLAGSLLPPPMWRNPPPPKKKASVHPELLEPGSPTSNPDLERTLSPKEADAKGSPKAKRLRSLLGMAGLQVLVPGMEAQEFDKESACSSPTVCGSPFRRGRRTPMASKDVAGRRSASMGHSPTRRPQRRRGGVDHAESLPGSPGRPSPSGKVGKMSPTGRPRRQTTKLG